MAHTLVRQLPCVGGEDYPSSGLDMVEDVTSSTPSSERIVWIDCEMTGLDLGADALVEVAVLVTDSDLNVLGDGVDEVVVAGAGQGPTSAVWLTLVP